MGLLLRMYGRELAPLGVSPVRHHEILRALLATSRTAQQATATYLSIKRHAADEQPGVLMALSEDHEAYYDVLADVLDERLGASVVQHLVAWNAAIVAFSSRYMARFLSGLQDGEDLAPQPDEQPDARLQRVLDQIDAHAAALDGWLAERHAGICSRVALQRGISTTSTRGGWFELRARTWCRWWRPICQASCGAGCSSRQSSPGWGKRTSGQASRSLRRGRRPCSRPPLPVPCGKPGSACFRTMGIGL